MTSSITAARRPAGLAAALALALAGCTFAGEEGEATGGDGGDPEGAPALLRVVSHDSFSLFEENPELLEAFEADTGYEVRIDQLGDEVGASLIQTADSPLGDVAFGIDNAFAGRALDAGVFEPYASPELPASAEELVIAEELTPIDFGDVCFNIDQEWFEENGIEAPASFEDLTRPEYEGLTVVTDATTSTPGLALVLATIEHFGEEGWEQYWADLTANGLLPVEGWSQAYYEEFSATAEGGSRPVVLSYASSPAYEPTTAAMLETCFRQVEYAGVIAGAENPEGARAFIDFLLDPQVQAAIPESMYVYPVDDGVELPAEWVENAEVAPEPYVMEPDRIEENRAEWIETWGEIVIG